MNSTDSEDKQMTAALLTQDTVNKGGDESQDALLVREDLVNADKNGDRDQIEGQRPATVDPSFSRMPATTELKVKRPITTPLNNPYQKRNTLQHRASGQDLTDRNSVFSEVESQYFGSDEDKQTKQLTNMNQKRYGKKINAGSYQFGNAFRFIALFLAVAFAPLQLLFNGLGAQWETQNIILPLQKKIEHAGLDSGFGNYFISFPLFIFHEYATFFFMSVIYLYADSLISFKANFLLCYCIVLAANLQMYFKDGRPFWDDQEVAAYGHCSFQFASPSMEMFVLTFYWLYNLMQHRFKYAKTQSVYGNGFLIFIHVLLTIWLYFAALANGFNYFYQLFMGQALGFVCLVLTMNFDSEIHRYCVKTGFILQASRAKKFEVFFIMIVIFIVSTIYYMSVSYVYNVPQNWLLNATSGESECLSLFTENSHNQIGYAETFDSTSMLFVQLGMVFGQSYSLNYVKPLRWVYSSESQKIIRTCIGGVVAFVLRVSFYLIFRGQQEQLTQFIWVEVVPSFAASFFVFGFYPIICQRMGLVAKESFAEIEAKLKADKLNASREKSRLTSFNNGSIVSQSDSEEQNNIKLTMIEASDQK